jgi:hypothetical protein
MFSVGGFVVNARADGDPASDYLLTQSTFLSPGAGVSHAAATKLLATLGFVQKHGLPLKVAVIVAPYDLGAVPSLFDDPETYADFLSGEDSYYWRDELIVVMPNGYGIFRQNLKDVEAGKFVNIAPQADRDAIRALRFQPTRNATVLVTEAQRAVQTLATEHGIHLTASSAAKARPALSRSGVERIEIGAGVLAALALVAFARFARHRRP